jgi:hypothetical protein
VQRVQNATLLHDDSPAKWFQLSTSQFTELITLASAGRTERVTRRRPG